MMIAVSFFAGYLTASFVDIGRVGAWLGSLSHEQSTLVSVPKLAHQTKPKLEFYTLLTANHGADITPPPLPLVVTASTATLQNKAHPVVRNAPVVAHTTEVAIRPITPVNTNTTRPGDKPLMKTVPAANIAYTIQVAAFRAREDAERMQASLLLRGFGASISSVASQRVIWFRVMVGPFASHAQALKAQIVLAQREHVNGMIRKMDA